MSIAALRRAVLLLLLHTGAPVLAQASEPWEPGVRHVVLSASTPGEVTELRITPGLALTLFFDTPVRRGGVEVRSASVSGW